VPTLCLMLFPPPVRPSFLSLFCSVLHDLISSFRVPFLCVRFGAGTRTCPATLEIASPLAVLCLYFFRWLWQSPHALLALRSRPRRSFSASLTSIGLLCPCTPDPCLLAWISSWFYFFSLLCCLLFFALLRSRFNLNATPSSCVRSGCSTKEHFSHSVVLLILSSGCFLLF